jgi:hypothetical protein
MGGGSINYRCQGLGIKNVKRHPDTVTASRAYFGLKLF